MAKKTPKSAKTGNKNKPSSQSRRSQSERGDTRTTPKRKVVVSSEPESKARKETPKARRTSKPSTTPSTKAVLPFSRMNYILLAIGVGVIALGFFLMSLDNFVDATKFSISLYIAPIVVVAGFAEIIYAIMYKAKPTHTDADSDIEEATESTKAEVS